VTPRDATMVEQSILGWRLTQTRITSEHSPKRYGATEIMVIKHGGEVHCLRSKTALPPSDASQGDANENGTRMRQTRGVECQTSLNMPYPDGLISC
jgi:hypothetical protein